MRKTSLLIVLCCGWPALEARPDKAPPQKSSGVEIDFSPLRDAKIAAGKDQYDLILTIDVGTRKKVVSYFIGKGTEDTTIRDLVKGSLEDACHPMAVGNHKLILKSWDDVPIRDVQIEVKGIVTNHRPIVKRLGQEEKPKKDAPRQ